MIIRSLRVPASSTSHVVLGALQHSLPDVMFHAFVQEHDVLPAAHPGGSGAVTLAVLLDCRAGQRARVYLSANWLGRTKNALPDANASFCV